MLTSELAETVRLLAVVFGRRQVRHALVRLSSFFLQLAMSKEQNQQALSGYVGSLRGRIPFHATLSASLLVGPAFVCGCDPAAFRRASTPEERKPVEVQKDVKDGDQPDKANQPAAIQLPRYGIVEFEIPKGAGGFNVRALVSGEITEPGLKALLEKLHEWVQAERQK